MTAVIIEDEYPAAERLTALLQKADEGLTISAHLASVKAAKAWFDAEPPPALIFSDVQLGDGLCFEIFDTSPPPAPIIFTTAYDEYALKAFQHNGVDYLLKPVKPEELTGALTKFKQRTGLALQQQLLGVEKLWDQLRPTDKAYKRRFLVASGEKLLPIPQAQVAYFQLVNQNVYLVHTTGTKHVLDNTLEQLETLLDPTSFFRANRQFIVQGNTISQILLDYNGKLRLVLKPDPGQVVIVSRERATSFKDWLQLTA